MKNPIPRARFWHIATSGGTPDLTRKTNPPYKLYLIACGLIGEPVPPEMISGGPQKKNS